jgi:hypothetical protein
MYIINVVAVSKIDEQEAIFFFSKFKLVKIALLIAGKYVNFVSMAILLVHLRRIILLVTVVYLGGAIVKRLWNGVRYAKISTSKRLNVQAWTYLYTLYTYFMIVHYFSWEQLNLLIANFQ